MMIIDYLQKKGIEYIRKGEEGITNCPFCEDKEKKFAINLISGAYNCKHLNKCGRKGSFYDFQKEFGDTPVETKKQAMFFDITQKKYDKPKTKISKVTSRVMEYLQKRGFSEKTIIFFGIGSKNDDTVMFPYYRNNELINVKYRSILEKSKMWTETNAEPILFNRDNINDDRLIITEGEMDVIALYEYGYDSVSVPMGAGNFQWIDREWDYLETFSEIYLCFDNDSAGRQAVYDISLKLGNWRCKIVILPKKDANECLISGISKKEIELCFKNAIDLKPETLESPTYFQEKILKLFADGQELCGVKTPWNGLSKLLGGWRGGEVTVWSGKNSAGKSTILNQVFIDLAVNNINTCIYSGEMLPERYLRWAIIQCHGGPGLSPEKIKQIIAWMDQRTTILNVTTGIDPDKLLNNFEYAARRYNSKHFIIDSLMKILFTGQDEYKNQQDFISELCGFAQKFNVHIHLVAHPRKTKIDDDTPGKVDIKGSSHITDLAHNVLILRRIDDETKKKIKKEGDKPIDMKLYLKKNRELGTEGVINMVFSEVTKRFTEC